MPTDNKPKQSVLEKLMLVNSIFAVGAGAYHGFCKARGIEIDMNTFAGSTLYGPSLLMGGLASLRSLSKEYGRGQDMIGSSVEGIIRGGIITAIGFGLGYVTGRIIN